MAVSQTWIVGMLPASARVVRLVPRAPTPFLANPTIALAEFVRPRAARIKFSTAPKRTRTAGEAANHVQIRWPVSHRRIARVRFARTASARRPTVPTASRMVKRQGKTAAVPACRSLQPRSVRTGKVARATTIASKTHARLWFACRPLVRTRRSIPGKRTWIVGAPARRARTA